MNETLDLLRSPFVQDALKAALIVAAVISYLGVFVVLKRIVFVGAALSEAASLGGALAFTPPIAALFDLATSSSPALEPLDHFRPLILGLLAMLLAVALFSHPALGRRLPREALIGAVFAGSAGLAVLVLSSVGGGDQHALDVLSGNILGVEQQEIAELVWVGAAVMLIQALFYKEFVLVSYEPEFARTLGYRSGRWDLLWYLSLGVMIAVSIHVAGTILVFAYLVMPAAAALRLSRRLGVVLALSVALGVLGTIGGVVLSVSPADLPTSPSIVSVLSLLFCLCWGLGALISRLGRPA